MKLNKAIFLFIVVISSLTSFSYKKEKTQLGLIEIQTSTIQKNATYNSIKSIINSVELELDEEQEEQDEHSDNAIVCLSDFISHHTSVKVLFKFDFPSHSHFSQQKNLLYIIFLKILI